MCVRLCVCFTNVITTVNASCVEIHDRAYGRIQAYHRAIDKAKRHRPHGGHRGEGQTDRREDDGSAKRSDYHGTNPTDDEDDAEWRKRRSTISRNVNKEVMSSAFQYAFCSKIDSGVDHHDLLLLYLTSI